MYSKDGGGLDVNLWTGEPLKAFDFLGNRIDPEFDEATGKLTLRTGALPVFVEEFPARRAETAYSLKRVVKEFRSWPRRQQLGYSVTSSLVTATMFELSIEAPPAWRVDESVRRKRVAPANHGPLTGPSSSPNGLLS